MFDKLFKRRRIAKLTSDAEAYISKTYTDPESNIIDFPDIPEKPVIHPGISEESNMYSDTDEDFDTLPDVPETFIPRPPILEESDEEDADTEIEPEGEHISYSLTVNNVVMYSLPRLNERKVDASMSKARATGVYSELKPVLEKVVEQTFVDKVNEYIQKKGVPVPSVYKDEQMDRRLFSKIISDHEYKPSRDSVLAIALALHLTIEEANDLLSRAGYSFSYSSKRDIVIEYFFREQLYDINDINIVLDNLGLKGIGR